MAAVELMANQGDASVPTDNVMRVCSQWLQANQGDARLLTIYGFVLYTVCMSKIAYKSNRNVYYSCKYHVVWCPKYRRKVLMGEVVERLKQIIHEVCQEHEAEVLALDPNFLGIGRCLTNEDGVYRFLTIRPGAYPWKNHPNAWRPAHIHFSVFGPSMLTRLVTQMYFPDDPLHQLDPIMNAVPSEQARKRLIALYDHDVTEAEWALGYRWNLVVHGPDATPFESSEPGGTK